MVETLFWLGEDVEHLAFCLNDVLQLDGDTAENICTRYVQEAIN